MVLGDFGKPHPSNALAQLMARPVKRDEREYHEAVGRLILAYGSAENIAHQLLRQLSGISDKKSRILFSKLRIGGVNTKIKELLPLSPRGEKTKKDILDCLKQLEVLGDARDKIAHRETDIKGDALFVSNKVTAKNILNIEHDTFGMPDFWAMQTDCLAITIRLLYIISPKVKRRAEKSLIDSIHSPWRYKPPQQQNGPKLNRQHIVEALLRQPQSSRP